MQYLYYEAVFNFKSESQPPLLLNFKASLFYGKSPKTLPLSSYDDRDANTI